MSARLYILAVVLLLSGGSGCDSCRTSEAVQLPGESNVLAKVNGTHVTQFDVQRAIEDMVGKGGASTLDQAARRKVLDSLVTSRAIALAREAELDATLRAVLDKDVAAYREERLVKDYVAKHTPPAATSPEMVEAYYREHPARFGAKQVRSYELIASERELNGKERDALLSALQGARATADWQTWVVTLQKAQHPVVLSHGRGNEAALHPKLRQTVEGLTAGQTSSLIFIQNRAYVARVTSIDEEPPRPLTEVQDAIRETLAPVQLKKALQAAGDAARAKAKIELL